MEYIKQIENIDKFREIKRKLRRKKDINSTEASEEIAQLFYNLIQDSIKNKGIKTHSELILLVKYLFRFFKFKKKSANKIKIKKIFLINGFML